MKMCGCAKGGRLKWVLVASVDDDDDDEAIGAGVGASVVVVVVSSVVADTTSDVSSVASASTSAAAAGGGVVVAAFGACSMGIARQSTVKMSPGFNSVFGLRTTVPFSLTFPPTTKALACQTLLAKHALNTSTSSLLSTSLNIIVPTGADASSSFRLANFSSLVRPPARSRPSIHFAIELVLFCFEDDEAWIEGNDGGRYQRSKAVVPI